MYISFTWIVSVIATVVFFAVSSMRGSFRYKADILCSFGVILSLIIGYTNNSCRGVLQTFVVLCFVCAFVRAVIPKRYRRNWELEDANDRVARDNQKRRDYGC